MKKSLLGLALGLSMLLAGNAQAFNVTPLSGVYPSNHKGGVLTITNDGNEEKIIQIRVDALTLENGKQVRTPTQDIRVAPSVITMAPNSKQTVRYLHTNLDPSKELAYRVSVKEIPSNIDETVAGVRYLFEYDFSWIWRGNDMKPSLKSTWVQDGDKWDLKITNEGNATAQLVDIEAGSSNKSGLVGYILPNETQVIDIDAKAKVGEIKVLLNQRSSTLKVE